MTHVKGAGAGQSSAPGGRQHRGFFAGLAHFVVHNPWKVIAGWIVVAFVVIATAPALPTTTNESSFLPSSYESIRAQALQSQAFPQQGHVTADAAIIVFSRPGGGPLTGADSTAVRRVAAGLNARHLRNILAVAAGPVSPNKLVQTAFVANGRRSSRSCRSS
jgi:putative drug exporter of the RND superfamily